MKKIDLTQYNQSVGQNVTIECDEFVCQGNFFIEDDVFISAKKVILGSNAKIEKNTRIAALSGQMEFFTMGDESLIGFNSQIMLPGFSLGDYSRVFNFALCSGYKPIEIGHNCWIGQSSILNSVKDLTIGNNVRMGGNSQIWTHAASGELLEGCRFFSEKPVIIEDNVWLMGFGHTVSPGVTLGHHSIIMSGSVVSKSTEPYHTYSGVPAKDVTEKLDGWSHPSIDDKFNMLKTFADEFINTTQSYHSNIFCFAADSEEELQNTVLAKPEPCLIFFKECDHLNKYRGSIHSIFDLSSKHYLKTRSLIEVAWMKFATGHRARFIPF